MGKSEPFHFATSALNTGPRLVSLVGPREAHTQHHKGRYGGAPEVDTLARLLVQTVMVKKMGYMGAIISRNMATSLRMSAKSLGGGDQRSEVRDLHYRRLPSPLSRPLLTSTAWHCSPVYSCWGGEVGLQSELKEKTHSVGSAGHP